jgi:hypothetical protein
LTFQDDRDGERRRRSEDDTDIEHSRTTAAKKRRAPAPEYGNALRSAYQRTLAEDIPPEMLDLLGKLG